MKVLPTDIEGVVIIEPDVFTDARGYFFETWSASRYGAAGLAMGFVQDNLSYSQPRVLRGLHLQHPHGQGKLVQVFAGTVLDVAVDVRVDSPTFGRHVAVQLSAGDHRQLYIPPGFAHGFCVVGDEPAMFAYKCTNGYHRESELGVAWNDPDLAIAWPVDAPLVSDKDAVFPRLRDIPKDRLPTLASASATAATDEG